MKVVIAGANGLIGKALSAALKARGDQAVELVRPQWDGRTLAPSVVEGADAVVNLAGAGVGGRRWTPAYKQQILDSRVFATRAVVEAIRAAARNPRVLVNASAVGFYGGRGDEVLDEGASAGADFLAGVVKAWEAEAQKAEVRSAQARTGVVLSETGGALEKMLPPFKAFVGGPIGSGKQWFPWIHLVDEVAAILWIIDHEQLSGPVNLVAPGIVNMKDFSIALGRALHRPSWASVPALPLKLLLGEFAGVLLEGQRAVPKKLLNSGFQFRFRDIDAALHELFG
jgi:uncharacterized protein (TIGR01777 family)